MNEAKKAHTGANDANVQYVSTYNMYKEMG